jgi:hypothetical protein
VNGAVSHVTTWACAGARSREARRGDLARTIQEHQMGHVGAQALDRARVQGPTQPALPAC